MKSNNIKFIQLNDFYNHIETEGLFSKDFEKYYALLKLRDSLSSNTELQSKCTYELNFIDFSNQNNGRGSGEIKKLPTQIKFILTKIEAEYIKERSLAVINLKIKAHYNHYLWLSNFKSAAFAKTAVDSYYNMLSQIDIDIDDKNQNHIMESHFKHGYLLSCEIKYRNLDFIELFSSFLGKHRIMQFKEYSIMNFIISNSKVEKKFSQAFLAYTDKVIKENAYSDFLEYFLKLGVMVSQKLGLDANPYYRSLGRYFMDLGVNDERGFARNMFFLKASRFFKLGGDIEMLEVASNMVEKSKKSLDFKPIRSKLSNNLLDSVYNLIQEQTAHLAKSKLDDIFKFLIGSTDLIPKSELLSQNSVPAFTHFVTTNTYDINKNVSGENFNGFNPYDIQVKAFTIEYLKQIFMDNCKNGKLTSKALKRHFQSESWFGKQDILENNGEWVAMISPAFDSFFMQWNEDLKSKKSSTVGYILCIDSLVLKFEGLLRELSKIIGAQTIEFKGAGTQERISFDKLLGNQKIKDIINFNDLAFFEYLFTSKGINLRNNVAHSFFKINNYSVNIMFLLTVAFLRLGNVKLSNINLR